MRVTGRGRIVLVALVAGGLLGIGGVTAPADATATSAPQNPSASVSGTTATISWNAPANPGTLGVHHYEITATDQSASSEPFGQEWSCADPSPSNPNTCLSIDWPGLVMGHTYQFTITAVNGNQEVSPGAVTSASVPVAACASPVDLCVAVDATDIGAPLRHVGAGLLHGVNSPTTPSYANWVAPLEIQQWRLDVGAEAGSGPSASSHWSWRYINGNNVPVSTTAIISDQWVQQNQRRRCLNPNDQPLTPWRDFGYYSAWLTNLVNTEVNAVPSREPTYWDAANEVGATGPFYNSTYEGNGLIKLLCPDVLDATKLYNYLVTTRNVLRGLGQKVLAPAYAIWDRNDFSHNAMGPSPHGVLSFDQLLNWSAGGNVDFDGFSYHENLGSPSNFAGTPRAVYTNATQVRAMADNYAIHANTPLFINEYLGRNGADPGFAPGRLLGMLWALTLADPAEANLFCYEGTPSLGNPGPSDCANGTIDGLLNVHAGNTFAPRSAWYALRAYAQLDGDLAESGTNNAQLYALSTFDTAAAVDTVRVLLGRYTVTANAPARNTVLRVTVPAGWTNVTFTVQPIPDNGLADAAALVAPTVCDKTVTGGQAAYTIPSLADNAIYEITAVQQTGSPNPAC